MADNLEYVCKECGFNWITLNGEHHICPKCHSETIEYIGEVNGGKVVNYTTPGTGPYWDERMKSADMQNVVAEVQNFINKGGK